MPAVALLLAVVVGLGALIRTNDDTGTSKATRAGAAGATHTGSTLLIGHRGADGRIDVLMLVGATRQASSVLLLPVATQVEVPSLGPQVLADLANEGGNGLLQTTIENVLGVDVGKTVMFDDATLNAALAVAAPLPVQLHRSVEFAGSTDPAVPAGGHTLATGEAARLLVAQQPGSELDRLVTVQDVMDGWLQRLRNPAVARRTATLQPALAGLVAAAKPSDRRTDTLPVESVATGGSERFGARAGDVRRYVQSAFPDALLDGGARRPRVEVLNGTGAVGLAQTIAGRIVPAGGQVTLTGNVDELRPHRYAGRVLPEPGSGRGRADAPRTGLRRPQIGRYAHRGGRRHDPRRGRLLPDRDTPRPMSGEGSHLDSHRRAVTAARAADDKKAEDTIVLDVGDIIGITEAFVITSGSNTRQVRTICDEIEAALKREGGVAPRNTEGLDDASWVLLDYGDLVVHVFLAETREYYDLERLWTDAPRIAWEPTGREARAV